MFPRARIPQPVRLCLLYSLTFSCVAKAENSSVELGAQLYGGEYYKDSRVGAYGIASAHFQDSLVITDEILFERYINGESLYTFSGIGAHVLWEIGDYTKFGIVSSLSKEVYDYYSESQEPVSEYNSHTFGLEEEFNHDPLTLAIQVGKVSDDYNSNKYPYLSTDIYYSGVENIWYLRGAIRSSNKYKEYTLEGYRTFYIKDLTLTSYMGIARNDLSTEEDVQTYHTQYDSIYAGCIIEFFTTTSSSWNLWFEGAKQESDTIISVELNITFGSEIESPYISAFGF